MASFRVDKPSQCSSYPKSKLLVSDPAYREIGGRCRGPALRKRNPPILVSKEEIKIQGSKTWFLLGARGFHSITESKFQRNGDEPGTRQWHAFPPLSLELLSGSFWSCIIVLPLWDTLSPQTPQVPSNSFQPRKARLTCHLLL